MKTLEFLELLIEGKIFQHTRNIFIAMYACFIIVFIFRIFPKFFFHYNVDPISIATADWGLILRLIGDNRLKMIKKKLFIEDSDAPKNIKIQNNSRAALEILISHPFLCKFPLSTHPTFDLLAKWKSIMSLQFNRESEKALTAFTSCVEVGIEDTIPAGTYTM